MHEYVGNMHCHTPYSDGFGSHEQIAQAALDCGLDFVIVTDHNVFVQGLDGYRYREGTRVLLLTGEEVHDQAREPQKNHLLIYEAGKELASLADDPQGLVDAVHKASGFSFLAHPVDPAAPLFNEEDLSWVDWDIDGYTGFEIWNFMTEFKSHLKTWLHALYYAYLPARVASGPNRQLLKEWDRLLANGKRPVAIGGADAHGYPARLGPLRRVVFPYDLLFRTVNTHVLCERPLSGDPALDRRELFHALQRGRCFVGYDLPASTRGFRFSATGDEGQAAMGDSLGCRFGVTLQVRLPHAAELVLIHNGKVVNTWHETHTAVAVVNQPGAYRVEAYLYFRGKRRGWIYSNPIHVTN